MKRTTAVVVAVLVSLGLLGVASPAQAALPIRTPGCGDPVGFSMRLGADVGSQGAPCPADGLIITASNVTLDLNGHTIWGSGAAGSRGVRAVGRNVLRVLRGTVRGFERQISLTSANDVRVSSVTAADGVGGFVLSGRQIRATGNVVSGTSQAIQLSGSGRSASVISGNTIAESSLSGIGIFSSTSPINITNNAITDSGDGVLVDCECFTTIAGNSISGSTIRGITIFSGGKGTNITGNSVVKSAGHGIEVLGAVTAPSTVRGNVVSASGTDVTDRDGIHIVRNGAIVIGNRLSGNTSDGIEVDGDNAFISQNKTYDNDNDGIAVPGRAPRLVRNRVSGNGVDGIGVIGDFARFQENRSSANGDDGFHVIGTGERFIENIAKGNGYPATPGVGLGLNAPGGTGRDNIASGNDDPTQCNTNANVC